MRHVNARRSSLFMVVMLLVPLCAVSGSSAQESLSGDGCEGLRAGDRVDAVMLIDQSSSMGDAATTEVSNGLDIVGDRLRALADQEVEAQLAVVGFGVQGIHRVLLPLSPIAIAQERIVDAQSSYITSDPNTDYLAGLSGARKQLEESTAECRLMLWFTDGQFDVGPDGEDSEEAPALLEAVCGAEEGLAQWFQDSNVRSYVILSNDWNITTWEQKFNSFGVLEASLSVMQAVTGSSEILDERTTGDREAAIAALLEERGYEVDAACRPFTQNRSEVGGIRLNAGELNDIFDVLLSELLGDTFVGDCPAVALPGSEEGVFVVESPPLPDGLVLDRVQIYDLNGPESALSFYGQPADGSARRALTLFDKAIDAPQLQQFSAGWQIEVEGPETMEICIAHPPPSELTSTTVPVRLVDGPERPEVGQDSVQYEVDLSGLPLVAKAKAAGRGTDGLITGFGVDPAETAWAASWSGGTTATLTFSPTSEGSVDSVGLYVDIVTGGDAAPVSVPLEGVLGSVVTVTGEADGPSFDCGDQQSDDGSGEFQELGLRGGEVPTEAFVGVLSCTVYPAEADVTKVTFTIADSENSAFDDLGFVLATSGGSFEVGESFTLEPGDEPVAFQFELRKPLANETLQTGGTLLVTLTWVRPGTDVAYESSVALTVPVDLVPRATLQTALLITLVGALIAIMLALGVFRFTNSLIKIPGPDGLRSRRADITILNADSASPQIVWANATQLAQARLAGDRRRPSRVLGGATQLAEARPLRSQRVGIDLTADGFTLTRRLPPLLAPFRRITAQVTGMHAIQSSPSATNGDAAGSFSQLILLGTDGMPDGDGSLEARVVVVHPADREPTLEELEAELARMIPPFAERATQDLQPTLEQRLAPFTSGVVAVPGAGSPSSPSVDPSPKTSTGTQPPSSPERPAGTGEDPPPWFDGDRR
ncbi:MAG: vWA domain-containing protein [Acidimicrobiales bacterium]